ncbi:MAG TPA: penicillin-insensitive murein endopeptidase, partial [Pantoea agglomerans]|nr:penicillin-insensitive murein endopeptidase [Pantoea agglomerans]
AGEGCGAELQSWSLPKQPGSAARVKREPPPLPPACQALLDKHLL